VLVIVTAGRVQGSCKADDTQNNQWLCSSWQVWVMLLLFLSCYF